jgi:5-methyltetrahydrofolate--homocysteine methyltransferase
MEAVRAANVLNGTDANCGNWIMTYRDYKPAEAGAVAASTTAPGASSGRRGGRAARAGAGAATE